MLLTLSANTFRSKLLGSGRKKPSMELDELPRYARERLGLFGLNLDTEMLAGADFARLDRLRDAADKASCPCLVLIESTPLALGAGEEDVGKAAADRMVRVVRAANRLGCNSAAMRIDAKDDEDTFDFAAERIRRILDEAESLEVNLLLMSNKGLTEEPDRLTELIKKIGGFRIGTLPDFEVASKADDPILFLRRLTPYASALTASSLKFADADNERGFEHGAYDLAAYAEAVNSVGYQGTLAIEYRGPGDLDEGVARTKAILEGALGLEAVEQ